MQRQWHAIYVKSRTEKKVTRDLDARNIEAYIPLIKTMRQWSDRKKLVELPLLSGYVFVRTDLQQNDKVAQTPGVVGFIKSEGKIAVIRDAEINQLKQLVDLGYHLEANPVEREYKKGDKVKITSGVLKGIEGYVIESKENRQIEVILENIGQSIKVRLPKEIMLPNEK